MKKLVTAVVVLAMVVMASIAFADELTYQVSPTSTPGIFVCKAVEKGGPFGKGFMGHNAKVVGFIQQNQIRRVIQSPR